MVEFGKKLKELRNNRNLSQTDLSKVINVSKSMISSYETTWRMPSYEVLLNIANFFNVSIDYLLGRKNDDILDISKLTTEQKLAIRQLITSMINANK